MFNVHDDFEDCNDGITDVASDLLVKHVKYRTNTRPSRRCYQLLQWRKRRQRRAYNVYKDHINNEDIINHNNAKSATGMMNMTIKITPCITVSLIKPKTVVRRDKIEKKRGVL